jgi:hypothetical protein
MGYATILEAEVKVRMLCFTFIDDARSDNAGFLSETSLPQDLRGGFGGDSAVYDTCEQLRTEAPPALALHLLFLHFERHDRGGCGA